MTDQTETKKRNAQGVKFSDEDLTIIEKIRERVQATTGMFVLQRVLRRGLHLYYEELFGEAAPVHAEPDDPLRAKWREDKRRQRAAKRAHSDTENGGQS